MDYVVIQSNIDINVTKGLEHQNFTNENSDLPNRLKVQPEWNKTECLIHKGQGTYPSEVKDWLTVKALVKDGILTVGAETNELLGDDVRKKETVETKTNIQEALKEESLRKKSKQVEIKDVSLDDATK